MTSRGMKIEIPPKPASQDDDQVKFSVEPTPTPRSTEGKSWIFSSMFKPQPETMTGPMSKELTVSSGSHDGGKLRSGHNLHDQHVPPPPEKKLTLFALQLAVLEKAATGLGALAFIWASVVLLGGFAGSLSDIDFWFITIILLTETLRIFGRSHELEWQHETLTWSISEARIKRSFNTAKFNSGRIFHKIAVKFRYAFLAIRPNNDRQSKISSGGAPITSSYELDMPTKDQNPNGDISTNPNFQPRTWIMSEVPLLPYAGKIFASRNISIHLYLFQVMSAMTCIGLSLFRLTGAYVRYGRYTSDTSTDQVLMNRIFAATSIFYGLALTDAFIFLFEKAYCIWKLHVKKLLQRVNEESGFSSEGIPWIRRFFYDAYSSSVNGTVFDGLKLDLLSFSSDLLMSSLYDEQLAGARMLMKFATCHDRSLRYDAFRKIGTSPTVMERLVEMLSWRSRREVEIRKAAAIIVSKITGKKQNSLRVAAIPGAMESISSLLHITSTTTSSGAGRIIPDDQDYEYSAFNLLGLLILKKLANEHDNCGKIGSTRGLLPKIIDFIHMNPTFSRGNSIADSQLMTVKRALRLLRKLVATTGNTGTVLRHEITSNVFTISNVREVVQYGENHLGFRLLAIYILTNLSVDDNARLAIGRTGGVIDLLLEIFFNGESDDHCTLIVEEEDRMHELKIGAGEALSMLSLECRSNCDHMIKLGMVDKLVEGLKENVRATKISCARILRNLCACLGSELPQNNLDTLKAAAPTVIETTMNSVNIKSQEVAIGLAAQIFKFMNPSELDVSLDLAGVTKSSLVAKLVEILRDYPIPSTEFPMIRRFVLELIIWMMKADSEYVKLFGEAQLQIEIMNVGRSTSHLECFNVFSGSVGLNSHVASIQSLVHCALELLAS